MSIQDISKQLDNIEYNIGEFDVGVDKLNIMFQRLEEAIINKERNKEKDNNNKNDSVYSVEEYFMNVNKIYEISEIWNKLKTS